MLQPLCRRTWAPRGKTPLYYSWDRHDRLSTIAALTVSPLRQRVGLYFDIHSSNIRSGEVVDFLKAIHRRLGRKFILVLDRYRVHGKAVRELLEEHPDWFEVEWLPPYAPELNPVEQIWNHSKYSQLANFIPEDVDHLYSELHCALDEQTYDQQLLRSYFKHAKLKL